MKEKFFFQEFVRKQHGNRIKEWIKGETENYSINHSITKLIHNISGLLKDLPIRFINHLSIVCASHQFDDIDDIEKYPICQAYGSDPNEWANVQYAAIILRTSDLLHVTRDRTPSVMYHLINITDPMGVDEWDKLLGTFAVRHQGRKFDEDDTSSHNVVIGADFKEERPFFAMSEYITWANEELCKCKKWADNSREENKDATLYFFPWKEIIPDIRVEGNEPRPLKFELDRGKLLDLLVGHTIYNDPTVAIREILQNSIDAIRYCTYLNKKETKYEGQVLVKWDKAKRELSVIDNGVGMNEKVIKDNLMKVGASFYNTIDFTTKHPDFNPISRFGIGILTCFMISDDIEILTYQKGKGYRIKMASVESNYLLKEITSPKDTEDIKPHGTKVKIRVRESVNLEEKGIEEILRYWIIMPDCPIYYTEDNIDKKTIGFENTESILKYYTPEIDDDDNDDDDDDENKLISYEIETRKISLGSSNAEISFLVGKRYTPERKFINRLNQNNHELPIVCVQGIRVDNEFPGFIDSIKGVLAIQETKDFKTTVSRNRIEKDDSYYELGKELSKCFIDYIGDEVQRIARLKGNPLSQASTVGLWIYESLVYNLDAKFKNDIVAPMYYELKQLVYEIVDGKGVERQLINKQELSKIDKFWTIESRLADYLGVISRDLGKELSVNEFLISLSFEEHSKVLTPIIYDAHMFSDWIYQTHQVSKVEFSRHKQQTKIEWIKISDESIIFQNKLIDFFNENSSSKADFQTLYLKYGLPVKKYSFPDNIFSMKIEHGQEIFKEQFSRIYSAIIDGDFSGISIVKTRLVNVFKEKSFISEQWNAIKKCLEMSLLQDERENVMVCITGLNFLSALLHDVFIDEVDFSHAWDLLMKDLEPILNKNRIALKAKNYPKKYSENKYKFDASRFWFDWYE